MLGLIINAFLKTNKYSNKNKGAQPGNKNASSHGVPNKNSNAEKHGLFQKYLTEEIFSIIEEMPIDPLDVLWDQIKIAYAAISYWEKQVGVEIDARTFIRLKVDESLITDAVRDCT